MPRPRRGHQSERAEHTRLVEVEEPVLVLLAARELVDDTLQALALELDLRGVRVGPRHPRGEVLEALAHGSGERFGVGDGEGAKDCVGELDPRGRRHQCSVSKVDVAMS